MFVSLIKIMRNFVIVVYAQYYRSRAIVVDFRHRFTVSNMDNMPVPIGQIHSYHSYV